MRIGRLHSSKVYYWHYQPLHVRHKKRVRHKKHKVVDVKLEKSQFNEVKLQLKQLNENLEKVIKLLTKIEKLLEHTKPHYTAQFNFYAYNNYYFKVEPFDWWWTNNLLWWLLF